MRRYECRKGTANKFWEIDLPKPLYDTWSVTVRYGKIGTVGLSHTKAFNSKWEAAKYHDAKVSEKLGKGYTFTQTPKPVSQPVKEACGHVTLNRKGSTYTCFLCGDKVEFSEPQAKVDTPEFETTVRRFFDLRGRA
jgi:predicted DNA-binding WGR domain protein